MLSSPSSHLACISSITITITTIIVVVFVIPQCFASSLHHHLHSSPFLSTPTYLTDFRYNTARVDGITNLYNGSLMVLSNGYYWMLAKGQMPTRHNVKGRVDQLYQGFKTQVDDIWIDASNDLSQQLYLVSNTIQHGLRVVCQEFDEPFTDNSKFCHLPVDQSWYSALKDIDRTRPINAVTWRNRTKNLEGGFWVFFQGTKMITIEPYEMKLRFVYDIQKWMNINQSLTSAYYDYHRSVYHLFFDNNRYFTWTVNVPYMNRLPMSWDRAFLHGTLSREMKINEDFFGFNPRDLIDRRQPNYVNVNEEGEVEEEADPEENQIQKSEIHEGEAATTTMSTTTNNNKRKPPMVFKKIASKKSGGLSRVAEMPSSIGRSAYSRSGIENSLLLALCLIMLFIIM